MGSEGVVAAESELVAAARRGDRKAFEELVKLTYKDTYTLALRLCGNPEDARDVTQDAYLRAWRSIDGFRGDSRFSTWMYRITANCAHNLHARRSKDDTDELAEEDVVVEKSDRFDPEKVSEVTALRERLVKALEELPYAMRAVVVLRDVYDLPHDAIAEELGISESAAKVRLHRARQRLRRILFESKPADSQEGSGVV